MPESKLGTISPSFRDKLLNWNLILPESIKKYGNNGWGHGLGLPVDVYGNDQNVIDSPDLLDKDSNFLSDLILINKYQSDMVDYELKSTIFDNSNYYKTNYSSNYDVLNKNTQFEDINTPLSIIASNKRNNLLNKNIISKAITDNGYETLTNDKGIASIVSNPLGDSVQPYKENVIDIGKDQLLLGNLNNRYIDTNYQDNVTNIILDNSDYVSNLKNGSYDETSANILESSRYLKNEVLNLNKYIKLDESTEFSIDDNPIPNNTNAGTTNSESYLDKIGSLTDNTTVNVIGSLLSGQGVGIGPNGLDTNFDIKNTLAGKALTGIGGIKDTQIGVEGAKALGFAIMNNVAFHTEKETIGKINTDIVGLMKGDKFIVPNYDITVPSGGKKAISIIERMTGVNIPFSLLPNNYSIYSFDSNLKAIENYDSIAESKILVENTGKGQRNILFSNLNANFLNGSNWLVPGGYAPNYDDSTDIKIYGEQPDIYESTKDLRWTQGTNEYTWLDNEGSNVKEITWNHPNSILAKTENLFKKGLIPTMVNRREKETGDTDCDDITTTVHDLTSKGNAVISKDGKTFCRTFTSLKRYEKVSDLQKHRGLYGVDYQQVGNRWSDTNLSVLDNNGFVRIAPTKKDNAGESVKRFMFSIENLAWEGHTTDLKECEIGPNGGRIMWFPPYGLGFNETSSVKWDTTEFIGRGEPIYTYNNTERSGNLTFKVLVDHPTVYNTFKKAEMEEINRFIFGCEELPQIMLKNLSSKQQADLDVFKAQNFKGQNKNDSVSFNKMITYYFPNDISDIDLSLSKTYEYYSSHNNGEEIVPGIGDLMGEYNNIWGNNTNDNLNVEFHEKYLDFIKFVNENETASILAIGYASSHGNTKENKELYTKRAESVGKWLLDGRIENSKKVKTKKGTDAQNIVNTSSLNQDDISAKMGRKVDLYIVNDPSLSKITADPLKKKDSSDDNTRLPESMLEGFFCEASFFDYLEVNNKYLYDNLTESFKEKLKYFQPAFHSITPEGFNSRLTFLLQCTRQGPTINAPNPDNLVFGRPPVCILRIGDFYHTKIVIDSVTYTFDEPQWDMNPEGIGIQPMIADVQISFKFIGGSSLSGPINRLQNAVSFNYFANTEMYEEKADRLKINNNGEQELVIFKSSEKETVSKDNNIATGVKNVDIDEVVVVASQPVNKNQNIISDEGILTNNGKFGNDLYVRGDFKGNLKLISDTSQLTREYGVNLEILNADKNNKEIIDIGIIKPGDKEVNFNTVSESFIDSFNKNDNQYIYSFGVESGFIFSVSVPDLNIVLSNYKVPFDDF